MSTERNAQDPLRSFFRAELYKALDQEIGLHDSDELQAYLAELMVGFLHYEQIFRLRDAEGKPVESLAEMLAEADVRLRATNFDREREVHRHIGDFLLFWSGIFPEMLARIRGFQTSRPEVEAIEQGKFSYSIVSSFDHAPYALEAPLFRRLSDDFEACTEGLRLMRASFEGFRLQGWDDGFSA